MSADACQWVWDGFCWKSSCGEMFFYEQDFVKVAIQCPNCERKIEAVE